MILSGKINKLIEESRPAICSEYLQETVECGEVFLSATDFLWSGPNKDGSRKRPLDIKLVFATGEFDGVSANFLQLRR